MTFVPRLGLALLAAVLIGAPAAPTAAPGQTQPASRPDSLPDFDIRDERPAAPALAVAGADQNVQRASQPRRSRLNRESGSVRVLAQPGLAVARGATNASVRAWLANNAARLGLERRDLSSLTPVRDYRSPSLGVRHLIFRQDVDAIPVFDSAIGVHLLPDGTIARVNSNAAPTAGRPAKPEIDAARARIEAARHAGASPDAAAAPSLAWLPLDGTLRLAWHAVVRGAQEPDVFDVLIDARTAELLVRRNRVRYADGFGRVVQGAATASADPRRPDPMPQGTDGSVGCPPPVNYAVRSLNAPFRDPATVLAGTGRLEGNNTRIVRGFSEPSEEGTFDGSAWMFDFPFNSNGSAETFLFFGMNFAHDFYYDLGFDEAAGNFQADNFGRGGVGGDPIRAKARAPGRNNANYVHASDGNSPTINMFLWDGLGCWAEDVDADGFTDLDGDYDLDIILHEYHHGVSLRVNTAFFGSEAGAIGEGGGDFFAYSVNNDTLLAEYSRPGGIRHVNTKGYGDWTCRGTLCEVHANGEIWANVLWDVRERFRGDLVRGSEAAGINESHQLYIDGLKLSPPRPTMLDLRDAMVEADAIRNPGSPVSQNYCRLWESFAGRGMGVTAMDTAEAGLLRVSPAYDVPEGCHQPQLPPLMTASATVPTGHEAGTVPAVVTFRRSVAAESAVAVNYTVSGNATSGSDYVALPGVATMPPGAVEVTVPIEPIDDASVEGNETVTVSLASGTGYAITAPSFATVTIVSDDVAPDLVMTGLSAPGPAGAGTTIHVTDTTRNQGTGTAGASETWFYLSANLQLDASDSFLGTRSVGALTSGTASTGSVPLVLPTPLTAGTYYLFAKADGGAAVPETNESNNTRAVTIGVGPDLLMTALTAPLQAGPGGAISVSDTTTNQGGGAAGPSATRFYLSANLVLDAGDPVLGARAVGELAAGTPSAGSTPVTIPPGTTTGNYYIFAQADGASAVAESNEGNNARVTLIRIGPDLTMTGLTAPQRAASGGTIAVTDTTRNTGAGVAGPSTTAFYLSSNLNIDAADIKLSPARAVGPLAANEPSTATTTLTLPELTAGTWFLLANADDGNAVPETVETNNTRFASLLVGPDLTFLAVGAPSTAVAGSTISLTETVRNLGAGAAGASVVRFYLSTNTVLDASDVPLDGFRTVPVLDGGASSSGTTTVTLPAGRTGNLFILFVTDAGNSVAEASETNNLGARFIQIGS